MKSTTRTGSLPQVRRFARACVESGFAPQTLRDAHLRGELAIVKVGKSWYVTVEELQRFVDTHTETVGRLNGTRPPGQGRRVF